MLKQAIYDNFDLSCAVRCNCDVAMAFIWVSKVYHCRVKLCAAQHSTAQHSTAQRSAAQHSTAQHSTAQHSTAQHSTAQRSTAQHSAAQRSTVQTLRSSTLSRFKIMEYVRRNWLSSLVALPVIILRTSPSSGTCDPTQALTTLFLLPNKAVTINIQHATHCCRVSLQ